MKIKYAVLALLTTTMLPSHAASTTISFLTDTWHYDTGSDTTGFVTQTTPLSQTTSKGSVTKDGVTMTFTASFVGTAVSGDNFLDVGVGSSMTNATGELNPNGFLLSTQNNDSTGLDNGVAASPTTGTVTSYQRWHFEFSEPVNLETFVMEDVDNVTGGFRDILGAEAFTSVISGDAPTPGSGFNPTFVLGAQLGTGTLTVGSENLAVIFPIAETGNPSSTAPVNASISFGSAPIRAFSLYAISNTTEVHRMALDESRFTIVVPEPSSSALGLVALAGLVLRRRR